jgi:hypothetical protein
LHAAPIPWPLGKQGRQRFLIVYGDLAEAVSRAGLRRRDPLQRRLAYGLVLAEGARALLAIPPSHLSQPAGDETTKSTIAPALSP